MKYTREYWQPRLATKPNRFRKLNESNDYVELINEPEAIAQAGTAFTAARLNNMESGIEGAVAGVNEIQGVVDFTEALDVFSGLSQADRNWYDMTTLGDDVYACVYGGDIYKQTNGTGDFNALRQASRNWSVMTTLGSDVYAGVYAGDIYKQTNGTGDFIELGQAPRGWTGMTTRGDDVYACVFNGDIYKQTNGTGAFVALGQAPRDWRSMTTRGDDVYACVSNGDIYKQTNGTGDFNALRQASRNWHGMTTRGDDVYACVFNGDIYKQTNGTGDFVALGQAPRYWRSMTTLGDVLYACVSNFDIYTATDLTGNTFRASSSFTLPEMPDGARKRILNTHATNAITVTAYSGTTIEGQATMTLSAGHEVELELIGTDWRKVVLSQSATPSAGNAMVWPDETSPGTPYTIPTFLVKDMYRSQVEAGSGGLLTVLYDDVDNPSIMRIIPKFRVQDIHEDLGTGTHPAFIVNGVEKSEIFIGAFQASQGAGSRAVSVPGRTPWASINFDNARAACTGKGTGWHMMSNWEWAAVMLWCLKNGFQPRGNTGSGRAHDALWETAAGGTPAKTGTGPAGWRHDGTLGGIADLVGNLWEWQDGMKLVDGQIYMPNDNHFTQAESSWAAQGVYFDSTGTTGTDETASANGEPILSAARSVPSDDCGAGLGANAPDFDYTYNSGESGWRTVAESASYDSLSVAIRQRMMQAAIAPKISSAAAVPFAGKGAIWCRNYGERIPFRGGAWYHGADAGVAALILPDRRSFVNGNLGFRPAFIG